VIRKITQVVESIIQLVNTCRSICTSTSQACLYESARIAKDGMVSVNTKVNRLALSRYRQLRIASCAPRPRESRVISVYEATVQ
jgi:hypothetical protein